MPRQLIICKAKTVAYQQNDAHQVTHKYSKITRSDYYADAVIGIWSQT
jgi:hypothetical protein